MSNKRCENRLCGVYSDLKINGYKASQTIIRAYPGVRIKKHLEAIE